VTKNAHAGTINSPVKTELIVPEFTKSIRDWANGATGDWVKDNALGRSRAEELRANIKMTGNYPALGRLVKMIGEQNIYSGVEVGFFQRTAELMAR